METQSKKDNGTRFKLAHELTLDQYIKRYAQQLKPMSYQEWKTDASDTNHDGKISSAESNQFRKRYPDDAALNRAYAEYLDTITKTNAYYKREAEKEWAAANYYAKNPNAEYENVFNNTTYKTGAQERQENINSAGWDSFLLKNTQLLLYAGIGLIILLFLRKK